MRIRQFYAHSLRSARLYNKSTFGAFLIQYIAIASLLANQYIVTGKVRSTF
jgi:hypothetical protein